MYTHYNSKVFKNKMLLPLRKSKLKPPQNSTLFIKRSLLSQTLTESFLENKKLTLIVGNAGYGKSSLVADYTKSLDNQFFWYSLSETDTDLIVFANHLIKGLKIIIPDLDESPLDLLLSSQNPEDSINNMIGLLAENLSFSISEKFVMVFDDFHFLRNSPVINKIFEYLIEYLPENFQIIIISRSTPNIKILPLLRVRQQLKEISLSELKFSKEEIKEVVSLTFKEIPDEDELENIYSRTEGWIGIIILLLQVYQNNQSVRNFLSKNIDNNQSVFAYLANEIYEIQSPEIRDFMLISSLLPEINREICFESGLENFSENIYFLKTHNLLDDFSGEFRYNPVLKDFLRDKARDLLTPEKIRTIFQGVAHYYLKNKQNEQALDYFLLGMAFSEAEKIIKDLYSDLLNSNRLETLYKYLLRFSENYLDNSADLQIYLGEIKRLWGNYPDALEHFYRAEEISLRENNQANLGKIYVYESIIHTSKGDLLTLDLLNEALTILPEKEYSGLALAYNTRGIFDLFHGKISESLNYFERALAYYELDNDRIGQAKVLHNMGYAYSMIGSFEHSLDTYQRSLKQLETSGKLPHPMTYNNIAIIYNYSGKFNEARAFAEKSVDLAQKLQYKRDLSYAFWTLGMISANLDNFLKAEDYFSNCLSIGLELGDKQIQAYALSGLSELARSQQKLGKAEELIEEAIRRRGLPTDSQGMIELIIQKLAIFIDKKEYALAREIIENQLLENVEKLGYRYYLTHLLFYLALIYESQKPEQAKNYLDKVAVMIKEHGYFFFITQQKYVPEYLKKKLSAKNIEVKITIPSGLKFYCFGEFRTYQENRLIPAKEWSGFKTKLALAYLLHNKEGVSKEKLANLLYPDTDITRTAINVILSRIRKALESESEKKESSAYITFNEGKYFFNFGSSYWLDTEQFSYLLKEAKESEEEDKKISLLLKIVEIYQGNFLSEFSGELWCQIEAENYRRKSEWVFSELFSHYYKKGNFSQIIELSEKELSLDLCNENAFQRKIKALIALEKKDEAMKHYKIMRNILKSELGIEPSYESDLLYQKLL